VFREHRSDLGSFLFRTLYPTLKTEKQCFFILFLIYNRQNIFIFCHLFVSWEKTIKEQRCLFKCVQQNAFFVVGLRDCKVRCVVKSSWIKLDSLKIVNKHQYSSIYYNPEPNFFLKWEFDKIFDANSEGLLIGLIEHVFDKYLVFDIIIFPDQTRPWKKMCKKGGFSQIFIT
jgi:hypothetical protein